MKILTIKTVREFTTDKQWSDYKEQFKMIPIDYNKLEKTGRDTMKQYLPGEVVETIYELKE